MSNDNRIIEAINSGGGGSVSSVIYGRAVSDSADGKVRVYLGAVDDDGNHIPITDSDGNLIVEYNPDGTPTGTAVSQTIEVPSIGSVASGQVPVIAITEGGSPVVIGAYGEGDAVSYALESSSGVSETAGNGWVPASIVFSAYRTTALGKSAYVGRIVVTASADGSTWTSIADISASSVTVAVADVVAAVAGAKYIRAVLTGAPYGMTYDSYESLTYTMWDAVQYSSWWTVPDAELATSTVNLVSEVAQHFWHDDSGVHVSTTAGDDTTGDNLLLTSGAMSLRSGTTERALFGQTIVKLCEDAQLEDMAQILLGLAGRLVSQQTSSVNGTLALHLTNGGFVGLTADKLGQETRVGSEIGDIAKATIYHDGNEHTVLELMADKVEMSGLIETGSLTLSSGWTDDGTVLIRIGRLCYINCNIHYSSASVLGGTYATLPSGYVPAADQPWVQSQCSDSAYVQGTARLLSTGGVYLYCPTAVKYVHFQQLWIIA